MILESRNNCIKSLDKLIKEVELSIKKIRTIWKDFKKELKIILNEIRI